MARKPRNYIAANPGHVVQWENARQATSHTIAEYGKHLESPALACGEHEYESHSPILLTNRRTIVIDSDPIYPHLSPFIHPLLAASYPPPIAARTALNEG